MAIKTVLEGTTSKGSIISLRSETVGYGPSEGWEEAYSLFVDGLGFATNIFGKDRAYAHFASYFS